MLGRTKDVCFSRDGVVYGGTFVIDAATITVVYLGTTRSETLLGNIRSPLTLARHLLKTMVDAERGKVKRPVS